MPSITSFSAATSSGLAVSDVVPLVDVSMGSTEAANLKLSMAELRKFMYRLRPNGTLKTPPLVSEIGTTWTWVQQSTTTVSNDVNGNLILTAPGENSGILRILTRTVPVGAWSATMEFDFAAHQNTPFVGLILRSSSTGKLHVFGLNGGTGSNIQCVQFSGLSSFANNNAVFGPIPYFYSPRFLRITSNGTTFQCLSSKDGVNFLNHGGAYGLTTWLGAAPDQIGIVFSSYNTDSVTALLTVYDFVLA